MNKINLNIRLSIAFVVLLSGTLISDFYIQKQVPLEFGATMTESVNLTKKWFSIVEQLKKEKGIGSDAVSNAPYNYLIGDEWSEITTTLGSLDSKEISTNPDFSALMVRLLHEAGITKGRKAGVILSGSFPALSISVLAALQTMEIDAVVMSSLGASTYGANQPQATWIDIESALIKKGGLKYNSTIVSIGAGEDSGNGLSEEGLRQIKNAAERNNINLYIPVTLKKSIDKRFNILNESGISILINIGGNQTALGKCAHSVSIPNGFNLKIDGCTDENRGLISRMNELGIPFINMLNIKDLAGKCGIDLSPGNKYADSTNLYKGKRTNKPVLGIILAAGLIPIFFLRKRYITD